MPSLRADRLTRGSRQPGSPCPAPFCFWYHQDLPTRTPAKDQAKTLRKLLNELRKTNDHLQKLLRLIPEESLRDYSNSSQIKKAYLRAIKVFPPE